MKYCLSVGLHNLFFDIAIVDSNHKIVKKYKCNYDRNKDISNNIYLSYKKNFSKYNIDYIGVGVSNNIEFKDEFIYSVTAFNFNRYDLKQSLYKLFKKEIYVMEETYLASLAASYELDSHSLLYLILDNKISNSFVIDHEIIELEDDVNLRINEDLHAKCCKDSFKAELLANNFDDDYVGGYFISNNCVCNEIVQKWCKNLSVSIEKIIKELPVNDIVFSGYLGEYFSYFNRYLLINKKIRCLGGFNHRRLTLQGVSHLMFKDNS